MRINVINIVLRDHASMLMYFPVAFRKLKITVIGLHFQSWRRGLLSLLQFASNKSVNCTNEYEMDKW